MLKASFALVFTLFISFNLQAKEEVVATVNGTEITRTQLESTYKQNLLYVSTKVVTMESVLNDLIDRELGIQRAKKNKLAEDPIVKTKIEDILYHAQISKDLEEEFKKIKVSDKDVKDYYSNYPEYRTAHILFRMKAVPSEGEQKAAMEAAIEVYQQLKRDANKFSDLAAKFSQSNEAPSGGDMGFQPAVRLAPEYFQAIKDKKIGSILAPVKTQFGLHIIKVLGVKEFSEINTAMYKKIIYDQKRDAIMAKYFSDARKGATIKVDEKKLK